MPQRIRFYRLIERPWKQLTGDRGETFHLIVFEECSYVRLKEQLIRRLSVSGNAKLNELTLGDRTLNQLFREMKQLGEDKVGS